MMRLIERLGTAMIMLAILAGPPVAATVWLVLHPLARPSRQDIEAWFDQPLTSATIIAGCVAVGGIGWLLLIGALIRQAVGIIRLRRRLKLALPSPAQLIASSMAGVAALAMPGLDSGDHPSEPVAVAADQPTGSATPGQATPSTADTSVLGARQGTAPRAAADTMTVHHGDRLSSSARRQPGDAAGNSESFRLNRDGHYPGVADLSYPGRRLSVRHPSVTPGGHRNVDIPAWARGAAGGACRVEPGDNLWDLADKHLGDPHRWREIYRLNRDHRQANGYALTDPDEIDVGWVLALPARYPDTQSADPPTSHRPTPPTNHPASPPTGSAAPSTVSVAPPTGSTNVPSPAVTHPSRDTSRPAATPAPPSSTGSPPTSSSAPPASGAARDRATSASQLDGVAVPGGWITAGLGAGLLAAAAMVWRRRRNRYKPTPITKPHMDDPDLLPPLAAMTRIRTSLRRTTPEAFDRQPATAPTVREYRSAAVKPALPPVGPSGSDLAGATDLPVATGLGLTGDGALDAARGLLVAALAAGSDDDPDAKGQAVIPAATLAALLGVSAVDLGHLDRLTVTDTEADAITALEEEIIRRSRLIAEAQVADVRTLRDTDIRAEPMPQLLLIAELPDPAWTNRLTTAVLLGHSVDIGAAIIGDWPTGTTLTVAADGTTGTDTRLSVLDTATAIDTLRLLREAHGDSDGPLRTQQPQPPPADRIASEPAQDPDQPRESRSVPAGHTAPPAATPTLAPEPDVGRRPVAVRVLGRPAVLDADGQPSPGIRSKAVELLVYLAVNRNGADLSDIMEALFPDANLRRASERLSTVAADLRKHIRRAAATPTDTTETLRQRLEPIRNTGSRYHIDPTIVAVDWWTVLDHYEAVAANTDISQQLTHLTAAIDAASGDLAQGAEYDWIDTDREVVRRHRIKLHMHTAALLADTNPYRSWLLLEQACEIDPLSDELARTTMRAAVTLCDADAIRHRLKTLREALDAHGLDITDDTETLARDLLRELHPPRTAE